MPSVRTASPSEPSGSVTTLGRFSIAPTPRMATCGWLMIGAPAYEPNTPGLVMVNVPRWISSGDSFFARAKKLDRKSTRLNSSHLVISYAVFCLKKKKKKNDKKHD